MSRNMLPLAALACAGFALAALVRPARGLRAQEAPDPKKLEIVVAGETVTLNGKKLTLPCEREELVKALGAPTREAAKASRLLTWDELGLYAYQARDGTKVNALAITFGPDKFAFWPKKPFAGTLRVNGAAVSGRTTLAEINRAASKRFERDKVLPDSYTARDGKALLTLREPPSGSTEKVTFLEFSLSL
jgi:hypothetical protein